MGQNTESLQWGLWAFLSEPKLRDAQRKLSKIVNDVWRWRYFNWQVLLLTEPSQIFFKGQTTEILQWHQWALFAL